MADKINTSFNVRCQSHNISGWYALEGDQFGAVMLSQCDPDSICPIRIGLINVGCEDTALYVTDLVDYSLIFSGAPNLISKGSTSLVAVKLNFQVEIGEKLM